MQSISEQGASRCCVDLQDFSDYDEVPDTVDKRSRPYGVTLEGNHRKHDSCHCPCGCQQDNVRDARYFHAEDMQESERYRRYDYSYKLVPPLFQGLLRIGRTDASVRASFNLKLVATPLFPFFPHRGQERLQ